MAGTLLLTVDEALSRMIDVHGLVFSRSTFYRLLDPKYSRGRTLNNIKLGYQRVVGQADLDAWVDANVVENPNGPYGIYKSDDFESKQRARRRS